MFKIVVTKTEYETQWTGREWRCISADSGDLGYTPQVESKVEVTRTLLEQNVEQLDLAAVIKAVNGIA